MWTYLILSTIDDIIRNLKAVQDFIQATPVLREIYAIIFWILKKCYQIAFMYTVPLYRLFKSFYDYRAVENYRAFKRVLIYTIPNTMTCFHKVGILLYLADFHCIWYMLYVMSGRYMTAYAYFVVKVTSIILPFVYLSPIDRAPFWILYLLLAIFEVAVAWYSIFGYGHGVDWERAPEDFYKDWPKHYRYRRMTTNRAYTIDLSLFFYPVWKILLAFDFFCYNKEVADARLKAPHIPVRGDTYSDALPTYNYLEALAEPSTVANLQYGVLFLLALSSLSVYSIILAGWSSNSKYAFIGSLRSAAQMISYEIAISLILLPVVALAGSLNLTMIVFIQSVTIWFIMPLLPAAVMFLIAMLAETNRTPFDLPEAEAELVAGYNVDYSALPFAMFFLGEYCNMILMAVLFCILFLGGWSLLSVGGPLILALKASTIWIFFVLVRATLPRYRYDQLMDIGWKVFLPIASGFLLVVAGALIYFCCAPVTAELPLSHTIRYTFASLIV